jgi:Cysteine-rich secretory protein family
VGGALAVPAAPVVRAWDAGTFSSADENLLFSLTNQARASAGLAPLRWDSQLAGIARWRVQDMSTRDYFSHQIPPQGYLVFHYMDQRGVSYVLAGENIGWVSGIDDADATPYIQQQFMNSPEHRSNILGATWDSAGVGAFKGSDGKFLFCVLFKQSTAAPTPTPKPTAPPTPKPVATARPTATPRPTAAPATPRPTRTPIPTPAPTPDLTPSPEVSAVAPAPSPSAQPADVTPADAATPSLPAVDVPPVSQAPTSAPTPAVGTPPSQRIVNDAPAPGLVESLIGGLLGLVNGS